MTHDVLPFGNINEVIRATEYSSVKAIENADIFTAINTIASDISSLPIKVTDGSYNNNLELEYLLNTEPNSVLSGKNFIYILIVNSILNGNAYAQIERDEHGVPLGLHYISNDRVQNIKKKSNSSFNTEINYEIRKLGDSGKTKSILSQDILHIKPFTTDGFIGRSPLIALKDDIETQSNSKKFFSNFFKNGTQSGGIIKVAGDLNSEDKEAVREAWQQAPRSTTCRGRPRRFRDRATQQVQAFVPGHGADAGAARDFPKTPLRGQQYESPRDKCEADEEHIEAGSCGSRLSAQRVQDRTHW